MGRPRGGLTTKTHALVGVRQRRLPFGAILYRSRNLVERFFGKLKRSCAIAIRLEKRSENNLALVKRASAEIWMRFTNR